MHGLSLPTDVLEHALGFLGISDLSTSMRVGMQWAEAVASMPSVADWIDAREHESIAENLDEVCASRLARHIGSIDLEVVTRETLSLLSGLPALQKLDSLELQLPDINEETDLAWTLPSSLTLLRLEMTYTASSLPFLDSLLACIGSELLELETLDLNLHADESGLREVSLEPLLAAKKLRVLNYHQGEEVLSDANISVLHRLPALEVLHGQQANTDHTFLRRLLDTPHELKWRQIFLPSWFDDSCGALLAHLPLLTHLYLSDCRRITFWSFLARCTRLVKVIFMGFAAGQGDDFAAAMQHCTELQEVSLLDGAELTGAHLEQLLPHLVALRELHLSGMTSLDSLRAFADGPVTHSLVSLSLGKCVHPRLLACELAHLMPLRALQTLEITDSIPDEVPTEIEDHFLALDDYYECSWSEPNEDDSCADDE